MITVGDIYKAIDSFAPFCTQEKWDNSGLLVGSMDMPADKIYITLDISKESIEAAKAAGAQLIVAHHPIIFSPFKSLAPSDPVWQLAAANMAAICVHTPLDIAEGGINTRLYDMLKGTLSLGGITGSPDGSGLGWIAESSEDFSAEELASILKETLGCPVVRFCKSDRPIRKIALCGGSGSSFLEDVIAQGCDALITGDIKHDRWYTARNAGIALFDCGHYHTECIAQDIFAEKLREAFPDAEVTIDNGGDPVSYVFGGDEA